MLRLRDIMTRDLLTVSPDTPVRDALELFARKHISGAPVLTGGRVVGVVSLTDLAEVVVSVPGVSDRRPELAEGDETEEADYASDFDDAPASYFADLWEDSASEVSALVADTDAPESDALAGHTVSEAMNRRIRSLPSMATVEQAADYMDRAGIHRVLVMDDETLVGLVSTMDITRAVGDHKLTSRVYVFGHATRRRRTSAP